MVASSLSTIVIHFPFRLMSGLAGSFFKELSDTMQLTLVASFLVTWLLLPVLHLAIGYKQPLRPKNLDVKSLEEDSVRKVRFLTIVYRKPLIAAGFVLLLSLGGWFAYSRLTSGFLPDLDEGTIVLDYHSPTGTDIEETTGFAARWNALSWHTQTCRPIRAARPSACRSRRVPRISGTI